MLNTDPTVAPPGAHLSTARSPILRNPGLALALALTLVAIIAVADYLTGYEIRLALLYLAPIALATWVQGRAAGIFVSTVAAMSWVVSFETGHAYSHAFYFYWEGAAIITSFVVFVLLLASLRDALARSDERFVTVVNGLAAAVVVEDADSGAILFSNRHAREVFGEAGAPALRAEAGSSSVAEMHDAASGRWYLVDERALRWIDGRAAVLRVLSDVTDEKRAREVLGRQRDAVHRTARLVALGEFASALAHELNQPLAAIATYNNSCIRLLDAGNADLVELRHAMDKSRAQATRAGAIIQRLRQFLRQRGPARAEHDLNEVVGAAVQLVESEGLDAKVSLRVALAPAMPPVLMDRVLIEQVVLNLLRNAVDAVGRAGVPQGLVTVATAVGDGRVCVSVMDEGDGIAGEARAHLFEPFRTTKPGGLGLGLSICRSIVQAHEGTIEHRANEPRGSVFSFSLPARPQ